MNDVNYDADNAKSDREVERPIICALWVLRTILTHFLTRLTGIPLRLFKNAVSEESCPRNSEILHSRTPCPSCTKKCYFTTFYRWWTYAQCHLWHTRHLQILSEFFLFLFLFLCFSPFDTQWNGRKTLNYNCTSAIMTILQPLFWLEPFFTLHWVELCCSLQSVHPVHHISWPPKIHNSSRHSICPATLPMTPRDSHTWVMNWPALS